MTITRPEGTCTRRDRKPKLLCVQRSQRTDIPRRRLAFDFSVDGVPPDFFAEDEPQSLVVAALSLVFPEGERFFVESVLAFRDELSEPELLEQISAFAAQEGMHSKAHLAFNAVLAERNPKAFALLEARVKRLLRRGGRLHGRAGRLAVTCALEHFTAILAESLLSDECLQALFHPSVRDLWLWHALEESEHKSVAFDVYETVDGSYLRRVAVMATTTLFFIGFIAHGHVHLMRERGRGRDLRGFARTFFRAFVAPGYFGRLLPAYLHYYLPSFHPEKRPSATLVRTIRERLFGAEGTLVGQLVSERREAA